MDAYSEQDGKGDCSSPRTDYLSSVHCLGLHYVHSTAHVETVGEHAGNELKSDRALVGLGDMNP